MKKNKNLLPELASLPEILQMFLQPQSYMFVLPGGRMPRRQTSGAIGYDVHLRAIVAPDEMSEENPVLRKTIFGFDRIPEEDNALAQKIFSVRKKRGEGHELVYRMAPHESVLVGIGFATAMPFPMFYWTAPRSGLAAKWGITVTNAPGTVDPDYRGEAGILVYNRNDHTFDLKQKMRIAQIIFQWALIPEIKRVRSYDKLPASIRGVGGFGSTGLE